MPSFYNYLCRKPKPCQPALLPAQRIPSNFSEGSVSTLQAQSEASTRVYILLCSPVPTAGSDSSDGNLPARLETPADLENRSRFLLPILSRRILLQSMWLGDMLQVPVSIAGLDRWGRERETLCTRYTLNLLVLTSKSVLYRSLLCVLQKPRTLSVA